MIYQDQLGRLVDVPAIPQKIISVVPSQTELLFDLGLQDRLAGITKFCIHPAAAVKQVQKIGGTKQLDIELIKSIGPDLIIANKEENEREQIEALMQHFPVWTSDINTLQDSLDMIRNIGEMTGTSAPAETIINKTISGFDGLQPLPSPLKILYFIWRKPYMVAGTDTFIDSMLRNCGFENAVPRDRYPELSSEEITALNPDVILLSSEPYPFKQKHIDEFKALLPGTPVYLVDGEMFSWYGSRLMYAPAYFNMLTASISRDRGFLI